MEEKRKKVHLVVAGASQFGQYACAHVLHRAYAHGTKVTLIVARKDEKLFQTLTPTVAEWSHFSNLAKCIEQLKKDRRPIDYVFDDNIQYLVAELLKEEGDYNRVGYVATRSEEHLPYSTILATCCDRVLIEKPLSKCVDDVRPDGLFTELEKRINERWFPSNKQPEGKIKVVTTCEHFAFRKGFSDAKDELIKFIKEPWELGKKCGELRYEFRFFEPAEAKALVDRLSAMQDGSILDVGVTHGLGPLSYILRKKINHNSFDLHKCITWNKVLVKQARNRASSDAPLTVPVLAETAAYLEGTFKFEGAPTIHLKIESGKGGISHERYFRFVWKEHSDGVECFFGVSLGAAGYTKCEREGKELKVETTDGGWQSDKLGDTQAVAENAQASMLEAFIQGDDDRFIPLNQACQIVRLGIEAQALGFCQDIVDRNPYTLAQQFDDWAKRVGDGCREEHIQLKHVWDEKKEENRKALNRLKMAIGIENGELPEKPCFRVVTIFGPVGVGNTDISEKLQVNLNAELKKEQNEEDIAHLIKIPRDLKWCKGEGSSSFSVERVMRELGDILKIVTDVSTDTASDLCNRVRECARVGILKKPCILIINGIDRLGNDAYAQLIRVLNELPPAIRIIMVSNRGDQACGWVIRSEELIPSPLGDIKEIAAPYGDILNKTLTHISERISTKDIEKWLHEIANNNITVYQQLCCYLCYIVLPKLYKKDGKLMPDELKAIIKRELAAINLPCTITPYPEAMLERISRVCIGSISSPEDLRLVRSLAEVPGLIPKKFLDSLQPGLSKFLEIKGKSFNIIDNPLYSIFEHTSRWYRADDPSDKGTFAIFSNIRRVVCNYNAESIQKAWAEIDRLNMLLSVNLVYEEASTNLFMEFFFNVAEESSYGFGRLDLDRGTLLESRCKELIEVLERNPTGHPDSRIHKFLTSLLQQKTNLGIQTRGKMVAVEAWRHHRSAASWETILPLMEKMADACDIVQRFVPFDEAFRDPFCRSGIEGELEKIEHDIYMMRFLASTKIALDWTWYWLYGVKAPHETHCSKKLEDKVNKAIQELDAYANENLNKELKGKEKDFLAVVLRVLSLLRSHKKKDKKTRRPFKYEIGKLHKAFNLLKRRIDINVDPVEPDEPTKPGEFRKGTFKRIGINQSIIVLLYLKRIKLMDSDEEKKKALASAIEEFTIAEKIVGNLSEHPFLLLTKARLLSIKQSCDKKEIKKLISDAGNLFCRIEWDYYTELTKEMEKEFDEDKGTKIETCFSFK